MRRTEIAPGVHLSWDPAQKFNRCRISIHFAFPARRETATAHALLPLLMERGYADCPDMTQMTKKLARLYGADLTVDARPLGANHNLCVSVTGIKDRFALEGEALTREYAALALGTAFHPYFVAYCVEHGWYGAENLSLIPGEVGASAVQNIGAYGVEVKDLISSVETVNIQGVKRVYRVDECEYSYRNSIFKRPEMKQVFVTHVSFRLSKKEYYTLDYGTIRQELEKCPVVDLKTVRQVIICIRESKLPDPKVLGNAGSFFMNPIVPRGVFEALQEHYPLMPFYEMDADRIKIPAGWMIDQCGWKGKSLGPAAVHDKQALVLVNRGGAKGADIVALSDAVRASVREKFGIDIHPEVNFI